MCLAISRRRRSGMGRRQTGTQRIISKDLLILLRNLDEESVHSYVDESIQVFHVIGFGH
jgi:hypothetical protein